MNVSRATQNSVFKNHSTDIVCGENHLYGIVLVHIIQKTAINTTKHLQAAGYNFFFKSPKTPTLVSLPHSLTSRKPRAQTKQRSATILRYNNKLTGGMCLLGRATGGTGAFCPRPQPERGPRKPHEGPLEYLFKRSIYSNRAVRSKYSNRAVTVFFRGAV